MACQELRADNDELRRQNAELEAKDWGWIMMDPWGCHRMRFPLFPTGFHMPDDSQQHDITTIHAKKGRLVKRSSLRQVASLTQQLKELQTEQEEQDG